MVAMVTWESDGSRS